MPLTFVVLSMSFMVDGIMMDTNSRIFDGTLNECNQFVMQVAMDPAVENFQYDVEEEKWILYGDQMGQPAEIHAKCELTEVEEQTS